MDFKELKPDHLLGRWRVQSRILSKSDPYSVFAKAEHHHFLNGGAYKITNGIESNGQWNLSPTAELIRNPLLRFTVNNEITNAIITRLLFSEDSQEAQLTIYLSTGLELVLTRRQTAA